IACNTDWIALKPSIQPHLKPHHTKALILGTGGASKAVTYALEQMQINYLIVSRNGEITYEDLSEVIIQSHTIIINCTPVGTFPNVDSAPDIPYNFLTKNQLAYDLIYNSIETLFLKKCKEQ